MLATESLLTNPMTFIFNKSFMIFETIKTSSPLSVHSSSVAHWERLISYKRNFVNSYDVII